MNLEKKRVLTVLICVIFFFSIFLAINSSLDKENVTETLTNLSVSDHIKITVFTHNIDVIEIENPNGEIYHQISVDNGFSFIQEGKPQVPFKALEVLIPYGKNLKDIEVELGNERVLDGRYRIEPGGNRIFLEEQNYPNFNESIYNSLSPYPENFFSVEGLYELGGYRILLINLFPVRYIPKVEKISYFENINLSINLIERTNVNLLFKEDQEIEERVIKRIYNPEVIETYNNRKNNDNEPKKASGLHPASYDYVIITSDALKNSAGSYTFQDLANLKNSKGIKTIIVTTEEIYANYSGLDEPEKIRNFIIDAYQNWGTKYVLLGGDGDRENLGGESEDPIIPVRYLSLGTLGVKYEFPADLYYAALDGTWNEDGDDKWGEHGEEDLYAEVFVGRAPVDSEVELSNFINKTLAHEASNDDYLSNALMVGELLITDYVWGGDLTDEVINDTDAWGYSTAGFPEDYNVSTLYERDILPNHNWSKDELISLINDGVNVINHVGHSSHNFTMKLTNNDVDTLLTNDKYFFGYTQGCDVGAFDNKDYTGRYTNQDCIAEHFVTAPHGAYAFIADAFPTPASQRTTNGEGQRLVREFFDAIFGENIIEIGRAHQDSKEDCVIIISDYWMRWCIFGFNLFGDPTTTFQPCPNKIGPNLTSETLFPSSGYQDTQINFSVTYTDGDNNTPSYVNVVINRTEYKMEKQDKLDENYTDGCIYQYSTYFQPSSNNYTYYFECSDGEFYNKTNTYNDLEIFYKNYESPMLTDGIVSPFIGHVIATSFKFSVVYSDPDNNEPEYVNISINSASYSMVKQDILDFNYMDGCLYFIDIIFEEIGSITFYITCYDNLFSTSVGPFPGPLVKDLAVPFDGLCLNYTIDTIILEGLNSTSSTNFSYSQVSEGIFNVSCEYKYGTNYWTEENTRIIPESYPGGSTLGIGAHTSLWIHTNVVLGDNIPISNGMLDHIFNVSSELTYNHPEIGSIQILVLQDITTPGDIAWYEKSTGILLNGTFSMYDGHLKRIFRFNGTNANFTLIEDYRFPTADFTVNTTSIIEGEYVQFNFTGMEGDCPIIIIWDFGDSSNYSFEKKPIHQYRQPGVYDVTLTIFDSDGDSDKEIKASYLTVMEDLLPIADFSVNATTIFEGDHIIFTFNGSEGNGLISYEWNFGDGFTSIEQSPIHHYNQSGIYNITLIIFDSDGDSDIVIKLDYIQVQVKQNISGFGWILLVFVVIISVSSTILKIKKAIKLN